MIATILPLLITWGPWAITLASGAAAMIPASAINANVMLKAFTAVIDVLALNFGHAKEGPPPFAVFKEIVTKEPAPQRFEPRG
jgi:hypothetical protein